MSAADEIRRLQEERARLETHLAAAMKVNVELDAERRRLQEALREARGDVISLQMTILNHMQAVWSDDRVMLYHLGEMREAIERRTDEQG